ncbi:MAG: hypothetical protein ACJAVM_000048 [Sulfitobacter sp.]|jgi:hypothetical protein
MTGFPDAFDPMPSTRRLRKDNSVLQHVTSGRRAISRGANTGPDFTDSTAAFGLCDIATKTYGPNPNEVPS